jgi:hypothetical protein
MALRIACSLVLAALALAAQPHMVRAQAPDIRSPEVVVPASMSIPAPANLKAQFPQGFTPGLGFGLNCAQAQPDGSMVLHTLTGRGPTLAGPMVDESGRLLPSSIFVLPGYAPAIATMRLADNKAEVVGMLPLKDEDGAPLTGLPPAPAVSGEQALAPLDLALKRLPYNPRGMDPQGVAYDFKRGVFWLVDGYRPGLARVSLRDGRVSSMLVPGDGLEDYLATNRAGWGFSGVSVSPTGKVYTMMRGVLSVAGKPAMFSRIIELDPDTERVRQLPYPIDEETFADPSQVSTGEVVAFADKRLLVLEQGPGKDGRPRSLIYAVDLTQTGNINRVFNDAGQPLEVLTDKAQWAKMKTSLARKTLVLDLHAAGFKDRYAESMTLLSDGRTLAVMSGHGFGLEAQIAGYASDASGRPVLDASLYRLEVNGALAYEGQPSKAAISIRPSREVPRLWVATLPKKVSDY